MSERSALPARHDRHRMQVAKSPQRLPKAQRRVQLIAVAREIVKREGVEALTMTALAQQADVSKPVVYEHFDNSEAVTLALLDEYFVNMVAIVREHTNDVDTLEEYISRLIDAQFEYYASGALNIRKITNGHTSSHATGEKLNTAFNLIMAHVIEAFQDLFQQQGISQPVAAVAGRVLAEMIGSTIPELAVLDGREDAKKTLTAMVLAAIHAISPKNKAKPKIPEWVLDQAERIKGSV